MNTLNVVTPFAQSFPEGTHIQVSAPPTVTIGSRTYTFQKWEDKSTNPTRDIFVSADTKIMATFKKGKAAAQSLHV